MSSKAVTGVESTCAVSATTPRQPLYAGALGKKLAEHLRDCCEVGGIHLVHGLGRQIAERGCHGDALIEFRRAGLPAPSPWPGGLSPSGGEW